MDKEQMEIIRDIIKEVNDDALFLEEDFDPALIGTGKSHGKKSVAVYDTDKCLQILIDEYGMSEMDAFEHFQNSVDNMEEGDNKPIFINDFRKIKKVETHIDENTTLGDTYISDLINKKDKDENI